MKKYFFVILIYIVAIYGQSKIKVNYSDIYLQNFEENKYLESDDCLSKIIKYDMSTLWFNNNFTRYRIGFIGKNYQRIMIHFNSVIKNSDDPKTYFVYGKSKVKENICEFQGTVTLLHARKFKQSFIDTLIMGLLIAKYELYENPNQNHSGVFRGLLTTSWYHSQSTNIKYDGFEAAADGYSNNEFVGIWQSYNTKNTKTCNWGDFRIPFSNDLDVGVGEFFPNQKYINNGWESYMNDSFRLEDEKKWW